MAANSKHSEEQTDCLSDYGTITSAFLRQEYFDFVCHGQENLMDYANDVRYYTLSIILGTVALSYGSVPLYKMVRLSCDILNRLMLIPDTDMHTDRLGRSTYQILHPLRRRRSCDPPYTSDRLATSTYNIQWLCIRHHALEVHAAATRSSCSTRRNSTGVLYRDEQKHRGHHWGCNIQRYAGTGGTLL